jgi:hypothetical protein
MSVGPRIVFVRFINGDSPKLSPWIAHVARVLGPVFRRQPASGGDGLLVWQLVSGNNRQLARSVDVHDSFEAASDSAHSIVHAASGLIVELVSEAGRGVYGWYASLDGTPVMTCARWYVTDRDRRHSIDLALRSVAVATLHTGSRLTDPALMGGDRGPRG